MSHALTHPFTWGTAAVGPRQPLDDMPGKPLTAPSTNESPESDLTGSEHQSIISSSTSAAIEHIQRFVFFPSYRSGEENDGS